MNITLYKASALARLESHVDEDGVIDIAAYDKAQITLAEKQKAVCAFVKNRAAQIDMLDNAIKELTAKKKSALSQNESLKVYLAANMKEHGISQIAADDGTFTAKLYIERDESLVIQDGAEFALELCNPPKPPEPSKTLIKAAIKAGTPIAGAFIVRNDRLELK